MTGLLLASPFVAAFGFGFWWVYRDDLEEVDQ